MEMGSQERQWSMGGETRENIRDLIDALDRAGETIVRLRQREPPHSDKHAKPSWWVMLLLVANLGIFAWVLQTLIAVKEDVAVIKCQLSDSCKHVVTRGAD